MTDAVINVTTLTSGTPVDNSSVSTSQGTVYRQRVSFFDPVQNQGATVDTTGRLNTGAPNVTTTITNPTVATSTTMLLSSNASARYRFFENNDIADAWLAIGAAAVVGQGIKIRAGGSYEMSPQIGNMDTRQINAISTSGSLAFSVSEGV